jgi:hypothetical protein
MDDEEVGKMERAIEKLWGLWQKEYVVSGVGRGKK